MLQSFKKTLNEKGEVYFRIKVRPNASRTGVKSLMESEEGPTIKIDVAAPPVKGRANQELSKFFEQEFGVSKGGVKIISGLADKVKLIKITAK